MSVSGADDDGLGPIHVADRGAAGSPSAPAGRRERKKEATRRAIVDAGFRLFAEKGFSETTVTEIAAAADVAEGTFYLHFPDKAELLFYPIEDRLRGFVDWLENRGEEETTIEVLEGYLRQAPDPSYFMAPHLALARRAINMDSAVAGRLSHRWSVLVEGSLRQSFGREFAELDGGLRPRIMATLALSVQRDYGRMLGAEGYTPEQLEAYLQQSSAALRAAQKVLQRSN